MRNCAIIHPLHLELETASFMDLSILTFFLILVLAFANGTNDVSKAIATLVGSGVTNYRTAIAWGTFWTMVGAAAASKSTAAAPPPTSSTPRRTSGAGRPA